MSSVSCHCCAGNLPQPAPVQHPGIGHHDVQPAELLHRVGHHALLSGGVAHVHLGGQHLAALVLDQAHSLGEILGCRMRVAVVRGDGPAGIDGDDIGPGPCQPDTMRAALPACGAGDVGDLSGQIGCHAGNSLASQSCSSSVFGPLNS